MFQFINFVAQAAPTNKELFGEPSTSGQAGNIIGFLVGILFVVFLMAFHVWMLIHSIVRPIKHKILWIGIIFFFPPIGAIVYYFTGRKNLKQGTEAPADSYSQTPPF